MQLPTTHYFGLDQTHYFGLMHQIIAPAFSITAFVVIVFLAAALLLTLRRVRARARG